MKDYSYVVDLALAVFLTGAGILALIIALGLLLEILGIIVI